MYPTNNERRLLEGLILGCRRQVLQISAGAERFITNTGDNGHPGVIIIFEIIHGFGKLHNALTREGI